jgi:trimethylamine--corrinoid protein Co-methyltransferase
MISPDLRFKPTMRVLSDGQIEQIHLATLEVLERTGVQITHARARSLLSDGGARLDGDRVRIPGWMVEDAIRKASSRVVLGKRNGERSVLLEGDKYYFGPSLDCLDYLDPFTDERRPFTSDDCRITASLADALPNYDWVMTIGLAADAPADIADRVIAKQVLTYCEKPLVFCCKDVNSTKNIYEMAVAIAGSEEAFRRAPTVVHYSEPVSPLVHYDPAIEKLIYCSEAGIPLVYYPAPMAGATAPATFTGTVVQGSAESLSGLVLAQLVCPGAPFIYGAFATVMDMATTIFSYGAAEMSLMAVALAQMAQHYRLPFFGTAGCSDAKYPDAQSAAEAAFSCLNSALAGANLIHDSGWLDHGAVASPGYIVLVNEILYMVRQVMRGLPVTDDALAVDLIDRVGPGGHYVGEDHTFAHFRDVWYSKLFDRTMLNQYVDQGSKRFDERLRVSTQEAMEHEPAPLPSEVRKELDTMEKHWT